MGGKGGDGGASYWRWQRRWRGGGSGRGSSKGGGGGSGMMVATASGGSSYISEGSFESNPQGYFSGLLGSRKSSK
ncbi:hypothetical protein SLEP1_g50311 [Rubroshorea leprosula]|uniref:Uncharacterized protein n=1 Tax=Rubroshorea leprosula TaxID=152421 RepID=A0AAV5M1Y5_9ROSI|nr:hypothetical protein SLEP1_g50311 [Rubroshorea leprosula]